MEGGCVFFIKELKGHSVSADENLDIYRVVKKQPFSIIVASSSPPDQVNTQVDFRTAESVSASLCYHVVDKPGKEVGFVKASPLEYVTKETNDGKELEIEAKIQTLSSQHQGTYFYIHLQLKLGDKKQEIYCELDTPPILVISKKGQQATSTVLRRKPAADLISEALKRIEDIEKEKTRWLMRLSETEAKYQNANFNPVLSRVCSSFRDIPTELREAWLSNTLHHLSNDEKNVLASIVTNLSVD